MSAPRINYTISIPERFELDSFDLGILDENAHAESPKRNTLKDASGDEIHEPSFLDQFYSGEMNTNAGLGSTCFTPVQNIFSPQMMDIDLEAGRFNGLSGLREMKERFENIQSAMEEYVVQEICPSFSEKNKEFQNDYTTPGEHMNHESELGSKDLFGAEMQVERVETFAEKIKSSDVHLELQNSHIITPRCYETRTSGRKHLKPDVHCSTGPFSPEITGVTTPTKRELRKPSRKRKFPCDEHIVLSNEIMRQVINDTSSLVCNRRKAPLTALNASKTSMISNIQNYFTTPLFSGISSDLKALFQGKNFNFSKSKKLDITKIELPSTPSNRKTVAHEEAPADSLATCVQKASTVSDVPSTPLNRQLSSQQKYSASTSTSPSSEESSQRSENGVRSQMPGVEADEALSAMEAAESAPNLMDWSDSVQDDIQCQDGWSVRTRALARYLRNSFLEQKNKGWSGISLGGMLEGKTRTKCATVFYETLVLKTQGFIDVKQELPFDDIQIIATSQTDSMFEKR
ncbi:Sister chromatid cohesion 1 protein 2 [Acorus gramineus]|uniref:Sister chromatid cohesion 1 protein 2 n=1 Tax=Acorus gramineus TaxID=55184 RepID=A0AAV9B5J1_ACOGR|nr:Sister chromatid cohesion 1 protein 2 [Acorus gramineus]